MQETCGCHKDKLMAPEEEEIGSEEELLRSSVTLMLCDGWYYWPSHIPRQSNYEYNEWVNYDFEPTLYSRPACSLWLRLKWLLKKDDQKT